MLSRTSRRLIVICLTILCFISVADKVRVITEMSIITAISCAYLKQRGICCFGNKQKSVTLLSFLVCCWYVFVIWLSLSSKNTPIINRYNRTKSKNLSDISDWKMDAYETVLSKRLQKSKDIDYSHLFSFSRFSRQRCWVLPSSLEKYFKELENNNSTSGLMRYEWARYGTFKTFPFNSPVMPIRLASNGFYYNGSGDSVTCFSCGLEYRGWREGDSVADIHARLSPDCHLIVGADQRNVGIHASEVQGATGGGSIVTDGSIRSGEVYVQRQSRQSEASRGTTTSTLPRHKYPDHANYHHRMDTFTGWPCCDIIDPELLVSAGFFYAGFSDCVRCFSCGGGLRNWEYGDGPWEEHARWFPGCVFLREQKGSEFIRQHREVQADTDAEQDTSSNEAGRTESESSSAPETVTDDFNSSAAQLLISMGYNESFVKAAIEDLRKTNESPPQTGQLILQLSSSQQPQCLQKALHKQVSDKVKIQESRQMAVDRRGAKLFMCRCAMNFDEASKGSFDIEETKPERLERLRVAKEAVGEREVNCGSPRRTVTGSQHMRSEETQSDRCVTVSGSEGKQSDDEAAAGRTKVAFNREADVQAGNCGRSEDYGVTELAEICKLSSASRFKVNIQVASTNVLAVVDTAEEVTIISKEVFKALKILPRMVKDVKLLTAGKELSMSGFIAGPVRLQIASKVYKEDLNVAPIEQVMLLGLDLLHKRAIHGIGNKPVTEKIFENILNTEPNLVNATNSKDILPRSTMNLLSHSNQDHETAERRNREERDRLLEEIRNLRHRMTCKICLDNDACIVFIPCGHMVSCRQCAESLSTCAVCRADVRDTIRVYPA
ncbi:uncharacterized protein LOC128556575 [Mercenaria mercenaria]|uniref:uncharacterized protein LOC128556575 n=1 Tax=Mercenaria mercenaria TaxID=6596 RepID=UPI00234E7D4F|nr:uncharacterized protein LOC128556575 [Mercenaria mercenaria]